MTLKINFIDYGIACRIGDTIYINKALPSYDYGLYLAILNHEYQHSKGYSAKDVLLDIQAEYLEGKKRSYWGFVLTHPSSWIEMLPIGKYEGRYVLNLTLLGLWLLFIALGGIIWALL